MLTFIIIIQAVYLILAVILVIYLLNVVVSFKKLVPYVPTSYRIIRKMLELAEIKNGERVIDLGSGSGCIILEVAVKFPNSVTGVEISTILALVTKVRFWLNNLFGRLKTKDYQVIKTDFLHFDLSNYQVVFCFLTNTAMEKLKPNFEQLPRGARIISYYFHFNSDKFTEKLILLGKREKIYIYHKVI